MNKGRCGVGVIEQVERKRKVSRVPEMFIIKEINNTKTSNRQRKTCSRFETDEKRDNVGVSDLISLKLFYKQLLTCLCHRATPYVP